MHQTQTQTERNKTVILEILTTAFSSKDFTALDRYLHPDYVQHNAFIPPAKAGLRGFIADLPDTTRYEPGAIIAEGDLVMVHGRYSGGFDKPLLGIDIFRFEDGLVVEHWDVLQDEVAAQDTVAGNPMFTNPQADRVGRRAGLGDAMARVPHVRRSRAMGERRRTIDTQAASLTTEAYS